MIFTAACDIYRSLRYSKEPLIFQQACNIESTLQNLTGISNTKGIFDTWIMGNRSSPATIIKWHKEKLSRHLFNGYINPTKLLHENFCALNHERKAAEIWKHTQYLRDISLVVLSICEVRRVLRILTTVGCQRLPEQSFALNLGVTQCMYHLSLLKLLTQSSDLVSKAHRALLKDWGSCVFLYQFSSGLFSAVLARLTMIPTATGPTDKS